MLRVSGDDLIDAIAHVEILLAEVSEYSLDLGVQRLLRRLIPRGWRDATQQERKQNEQAAEGIHVCDLTAKFFSL
jgi:hypothetical protein